MAIKEVQEMFTGQYVDFEVYRNFNSNKMGFHTDRIKSADIRNCETVTEEDVRKAIEFVRLPDEMPPSNRGI